MEYTPFSAKRVFGITILESIYGFSALLLSKQTTGSFAYVLGPGFISQKNTLYMDGCAGIFATIPLLLFGIILNQFNFYVCIQKLKSLTRMSVLFIFGMDFRPITVGISALLFAIAAGIGEEMFFRAIVQEEMSKLTSEPIGVCVSVLLFGLVHALTPTYAILASLAGGYFSWLYIVSGHSIIVPAITHSIYDWIIFMHIHYEVTKGSGLS